MSLGFSLIVVFFIIILVIYFFLKGEDIEQEDPYIIFDEYIEKEVIEKVYQLNTSPIKLSFYPLSKFKSFYTKNLYQDIVIDRYWINEPFHTMFAKLLYITDGNSLWMKSKKTKEIVLNLRGVNLEELQAISFKVLDIKEIMQAVVLDIVRVTNKKLERKQIEEILLSAMIFVLSKSENINIICQDIDTKNTDDKDIANSIINTIFSELSCENKKNMSPMDNLNYKLVVQIFEENIAYVREYPNTVYTKNDTKYMLDKLSYLPKKQLTSIK